MPETQKRVVAENKAIDQTGTITTAEARGDAYVSLNIEATADASYALDVGYTDDSGTRQWFNNEETYDQADVSDPQDIRDTFVLGDERMRIRVTSAASNGETATVVIQIAN